VALTQIFLWVFRFPVSLASPLFHTLSFTYHRRYLILCTDNIVTEHAFKNLSAIKFCSGLVQNYRLSRPKHFCHRRPKGRKNLSKSEATESVKVTDLRNTKPCSFVVMCLLSRGGIYMRYQNGKNSLMTEVAWALERSVHI
jgi:hypothetical protein